MTRIPNDMCEYDVAGGLVGPPARRRALRHPGSDGAGAKSEIVIEGTVPTDIVEMEGAFGEFPGYMAQRDYSFFMDVTAITMKKKPIYLVDPQPDAAERKLKMRHIGRAAAAYKLLRDNGFDNVSQVEYLECAGSNAIVVVKIKKRHADDAKDALRLLAEKFIGKIAIAVDDDINVADAENILWAIAYRSQPYRDTEIVDAPLFALDPIGRAARRIARAHQRQAAALLGAADRRHHALGLSAAVAAEAANTWSARSRCGATCNCRRST